jgi:glycosyltransferase involved in cell wall biosynthesis
VPPRILHLSTYQGNGGAGRAAYALHRAMVDSGLDSRMRVGVRDSADPTVVSGGRKRLTASSLVDRQLWSLQKSPDITWRSVAKFGCLSAREINADPSDIVNLHWVTDGFLSIEEIGRIRKPIVWTMHDMWPFTGTEHYADDNTSARWRTGYTKANRPGAESGVDLDRYTYDRKRKNWEEGIPLVPVSNWLGDLAKESALAHLWPIRVIPNVMDTETFVPVDRDQAREQLGLPMDEPLVVFIASAGIDDHRKGWDLLAQAMNTVIAQFPDAGAIVVGPVTEEQRSRDFGFTVHWIGEVLDNSIIRTAIAASDVSAVPSRADNLPLTALEAQSCGRAVVAFDTGGLPDIVEHEKSGYLSPAFDTNAFGRGLVMAIEDSRGQGHWADEARARALRLWSARAVVPAYLDLYAHVLSAHSGSRPSKVEG